MDGAHGAPLPSAASVCERGSSEGVGSLLAPAAARSTGSEGRLGLDLGEGIAGESNSSSTSSGGTTAGLSSVAGRGLPDGRLGRACRRMCSKKRDTMSGAN